MRSNVFNESVSCSVFNIEINVGWLGSISTDKPLENSAPLNWVHLRDTKQETNERPVSRSPCLHKDIVIFTPPNDLSYQNEISGEPELFNDIQFFRESFIV